MVLVESLIYKMDALSGNKEFKGFIETSESEFFDSASARDIKLDEEMLRASIAAEQDASALYRQYAEKTSNKSIKDVMISVANEEDVHIGEFQHVLETLNPEYLARVTDGKNEVSGELNKDAVSIDAYEFFIGSLAELSNCENVTQAMYVAMENLNKNPNYYNGEEIKKEYQLVGQSNINVARMIKNMSKVHVPKFDTKRNMSDRLKNLFKMPSPKDDMNAANSNREAFEKKDEKKEEDKKEQPLDSGDKLPFGNKPVVEEKPETIVTKGLDNDGYSLVGVFVNENEAVDVLKDLLSKKRNAKMGQNKDGRFEVTVQEGFVKATPENGIGHIEGGKEYLPEKEELKEDNTIDNSGSIVGVILPKKKEE